MDYACGPGTITNEIAGNVKEIHAIDISSKMIEASKRKTGERRIKNINYAQTTIFDESLKRESFDAILAFYILHLLKDTHKIMQRINELLRPGGLFISATPCMGESLLLKSLFFLFLFPAGKLGIVPPDVRFFTISKLKDIIIYGGHRIIEVENLRRNPAFYFVTAKKIKEYNNLR